MDNPIHLRTWNVRVCSWLKLTLNIPVVFGSSYHYFGSQVFLKSTKHSSQRRFISDKNSLSGNSQKSERFASFRKKIQFFFNIFRSIFSIKCYFEYIFETNFSEKSRVQIPYNLIGMIFYYLQGKSDCVIFFG